MPFSVPLMRSAGMRPVAPNSTGVAVSWYWPGPMFVALISPAYQV